MLLLFNLYRFAALALHTADGLATQFNESTLLRSNYRILLEDNRNIQVVAEHMYQQHGLKPTS